ncbi:MAG: DEAD/DEAH box helicase [Gammaproteobacteria bacterium]|nr:DEAD/DEAH box helicase [Gammaproteobacteria bacterium]
MTFANLGLHELLLRALEDEGYKEPTDIQAKAIPVILKGHDMIASAQTGTGKTASFALPMLQKLARINRASGNHTKSLILAPTRELAIQIFENIQSYGRYFKVRTTVVYGGVKINPQMMRLRSGTEILIATPGRLLDLVKQNALRFSELEVVVLDEADRMLDMGFIHDIRRIMSMLPQNRQTLLFSATFADEVKSLAQKFMHQPTEVNVAPPNQTAHTVKHVMHPVDKVKKAELLVHLILENRWPQALIFSKTKHGANKLVKKLASAGIRSMAIHGDKTQAQRQKALNDFKNGTIAYLVATDIAARGIDIDDLPFVVNVDLPHVAEDYVHRIGRTGRAGKTGQAISLVSADEFPYLLAIEKLTKKMIPRVEIDDFEPEHIVPSSNNPNALKRKVVKRMHQNKSRQQTFQNKKKNNKK